MARKVLSQFGGHLNPFEPSNESTLLAHITHQSIHDPSAPSPRGGVGAGAGVGGGGVGDKMGPAMGLDGTSPDQESDQEDEDDDLDGRGGMEEGESDYSIVHLGRGAFPNSWRTGVLFRLKALRMCNLCNANDGKTGDETTTKRGIL